MKVKKIVLTAMFTALTAAGAQICIPAGSVPVTLQVFFVIMAGLILKGRLGFLSQLSYVLLGIMGFPVFAGFKGGIVHIVGPTGGYLLAFPVAAWISGRFSMKRKWSRYIAGSIAGIAVIYVMGALWLSIYLRSVKSAILVGILPFVFWDVIKAFVASYIAFRYESYFKFNF